jgi:hypothetical protein
MPLEFALRPRFDLERPPRQPKLRRLRIPPLALFMPAYWLAIAGATALLLRNIADEPSARESGDALLQPAELDAPPSRSGSGSSNVLSAQSSVHSTTTPSLEPVASPPVEPATSVPIAPAPLHDLEPPLESSPPVQQAAAAHLVERPAQPPVDHPLPPRLSAADDTPA